MMKICVVTGTRAEYGLLFHVLKGIKKSKKIKLQLIVTGSHLSKKHGFTVEKIVKDGFVIDERIKLPLHSRNSFDISKSVSIAIAKHSKVFDKLKPDLLLVLGDRYEIFAAAQAAMFSNIPIAHIAGGDVTEGAIDDAMRHSISKMSHLHFVTNDLSRKRLLFMGENKKNIFNFGSPGIDMIKKIKYLPKNIFLKEIRFPQFDKNILVTYHPTTINDTETIINEIVIVLKALEKLPKNYGVIFTGSNSDLKGDFYNKKIKKFVDQNKNMKFYLSLGHYYYLNALKHCDCVVGNSSSGLYEAPSFKTPTVNIGDRQKGRICADSVINCDLDINKITKSIIKSFDRKYTKLHNPYGKGNASEEIVKILEKVKINKKILRKTFNIYNEKII